MQHGFAVAFVASLALGCAGGGGNGAIVANGHVEATELRVSSKIGGKLAAVAVSEGDRVGAGQELARIDPTDLQLALDAARAEAGQADAELRLRLAGSRAEDIAEAEAAVRRAEADLAGGQKDLERMDGLLASGSGTTKARDDARTRRDLASASLDGAKERLRRLIAGSRPQEVDAARARSAAARARIAQLEQQVRDTTVVAPAAGLVTERLVEPGEVVRPGAPLLVVSDIEHAWLNVYVPAGELGRVRVGQPVRVVTDDGQERRGRLTFVASQAEFTPKNAQTREERAKLVYRLKVSLENADGLFKPGMPAEARLEAAEPAK